MEAHEPLVRPWSDEAAAAIVVSRALPVEFGMPSAPRKPGLYAIHTRAPVWLVLGLDEPPDERPL
jgi:hypothetical protein